jgi:uncharacterized SAM-binding protein YcdF (DUF218 family)
MQPGELKPILTALVLPPAGPLLLALAGLVLLAARRRVAGLLVGLGGLAALWLASCNAVGIWLAQALLPLPPPLAPAQLQDVQAIVVLGGGVLREAPEYGASQPSAHTLARLRYGAWLARASGKPVAFAGGVGWASAGTDMAPEGEVARRTAQEWGLALRWVDARSRDTAENAQEMRRLLGAEGVQRVALVTDAWHMPRSVLAFRAVGFQVTPAPTGFAAARTRPLLEWLPSAEGLSLSRQVLREWVGLRVASL